MPQTEGETQRSRIPGGLLPGPHIEGHSIQRDEEHHAFLIDQKLITCTPTEYRALALLLEQADRCVPYAQLGAQFQDEQLLADAMHLKQARIRLTHLMSDLRAKIWAFGLDIAAVMNTGYILLSSQTPMPDVSPGRPTHTLDVEQGTAE